MKAQIFFFHGANNKYESLTGYKHLEEIPAHQIWDVARMIFNKGLNVMVFHSSEHGITLMVDDKRFQQR
jgi:hypothetical protein